MHLVLIDLDGTLIRRPSTEKRFAAHLFLRGVIGPRQLLAAGAFLVREGRRPGAGAAKRNKAYLTGLRVREVEAAARDFVDRQVAPRIEPVMASRIRGHLKNGDLTVLLTGSLSCLAEPMASRLGIHHCIPTRCPDCSGLFTGAPPDQHPWGFEKRRLAEAFCRRSGMRLSDCTAYADAADDLPLLRSVSHPVAVNPDRRLEREAIRMGWPVLGKQGRPAGRPGAESTGAPVP